MRRSATAARQEPAQPALAQAPHPRPAARQGQASGSLSAWSARSARQMQRHRQQGRQTSGCHRTAAPRPARQAANRHDHRAWQRACCAHEQPVGRHPRPHRHQTTAPRGSCRDWWSRCCSRAPNRRVPALRRVRPDNWPAGRHPPADERSCHPGTAARAAREACAATTGQNRHRDARRANRRKGNSPRHRAEAACRFRGPWPSKRRGYGCPWRCHACAGFPSPPRGYGVAASRWCRASDRPT